jgi:1-acyl-sn-glycerol-3-phosphate acyltransferase
LVDRMKAPAQSAASPPMPETSNSSPTSRMRAWLYGLYAWSLFVPIFLFASGLVLLLRKPAYGRPVARFACRLLFRLAGMPITAIGLDRLPARSHVLLINHTSFLDALVLLALLPCNPGYAFVVRQEFNSQRLLCPVLRALGTLVLGPPGTGRGTRAMSAALRRGTRLVVFPEAGFRPEPGLRPFHSGALVAASLAQAPIVIAGLRGGRRALPGRTWLPRRTAIEMEIGAALQPAAIDSGIPAQLEQVRLGVALLSGEMPVAPEPSAGHDAQGGTSAANLLDAQ